MKTQQEIRSLAYNHLMDKACHHENVLASHQSEFEYPAQDEKDLIEINIILDWLLKNPEVK